VEKRKKKDELGGKKRGEKSIGKGTSTWDRESGLSIENQKEKTFRKAHVRSPRKERPQREKKRGGGIKIILAKRRNRITFTMSHGFREVGSWLKGVGNKMGKDQSKELTTAHCG